MAIGEFAEQLTKDKEDERELREAKIVEQEKAAMSVSTTSLSNSDCGGGRGGVRPASLVLVLNST